MAQVLQRSMNLELDLFAESKDPTEVVARVAVEALMSQPVDHDERSAKKRHPGTLTGQTHISGKISCAHLYYSNSNRSTE